MKNNWIKGLARLGKFDEISEDFTEISHGGKYTAKLSESQSEQFKKHLLDWIKEEQYHEIESQLVEALEPAEGNSVKIEYWADLGDCEVPLNIFAYMKCVSAGRAETYESPAEPPIFEIDTIDEIYFREN